MFLFSLEEVQFIKDHLKYPQDNDKASMYYDLVKKMRDIVKSCEGRFVGAVIIDDPLAKLPYEESNGEKQAVFFVGEEAITIEESIERFNKKRKEFSEKFHEQNVKIQNVINDLCKEHFKEAE